MNIEADFLNALRGAGLNYSGEIIADGQLHRIKVNGDRKPDAWYVLHADDPAAGIFGHWKTGLSETWKADSPERTDAERAEQARKIEAARKIRQADEARRNDAAANQAQALLDAAQDARNDHPYLIKKGVKAHPGVKVGAWSQRQKENCLLIPLRKANGALATVQAIYPAKPATGRDKDFLIGGEKKGVYFVIGDLATAPMIIIAEGYATAATLHEATGYPAVMAVDSGNLKPVAEILKQLHPKTRFIIAADNDRKEDGTNPGVKAGKAAAKAIKAALAVPSFNSPLENDLPGTDFNDMAALHGLARVRQTVEAALDAKNSATLACSNNKNPSQSSLSSQTISYSFITLHNPSQPFTFETDVPDLEDADEKGRPILIESNAAARLATRLKDHFAFSRESLGWYFFVGTHWQAIPTHILDEVIVKALYAGAPSGFKARHVAALISLLSKGQCPLASGGDQAAIPFSNGLLNPARRTLTPPTPETALTWCLPYAYDPRADCPTIKAWLYQAVGEDSDMVEFLRAWLAALLTGRADLQKFLHLLGAPGSGKGAFMRLATALIGPHNAVTTDLRNLETNRFETAALYEKRLAVISDASKYGGSVDVLKSATGQDWLRLERKHQQQGSTFIFNGLVLMASNEGLMTTDYTSALERRRLTVRFDRVASDEERRLWDEQGGETAVLHREIPGLVNWLLALSRDHVTRAIMDPPARLRETNQEALRYGNPIADWLLDSVVPDRGYKAKIGDKRPILRDGRAWFEYAGEWLYPNYLTWCQRSGRESVSLTRFSTLVLDVAKSQKFDVIKIRLGTGIYLQGIRLRREGETAYIWTPALNVEVF